MTGCGLKGKWSSCLLVFGQDNERLRGKKRNRGNSLVVSEAEGVSCALWFRL